MAAFGRELTRRVLHPELLPVIAAAIAPIAGGAATPAPLVVVHDAAMSRIPWEALQLESGPPAPQGGISHRYLGTPLSVTKWMEECQQGAVLKVLLVVDPTEKLAGARAEGARVKALLDALPYAEVSVMEGPQARRS